MKKKLRLLAGVLMLSLVAMMWSPTEVSAQDNVTDEQEFSCLLTSEDAIIGKMGMQTRGAYLLNGVSVIKEAGAGKIAAGGTTTATQNCAVSVNVIVERLSGGSWTRVTSWTGSLASSVSVSSSKTLSVGTGYYYRVRCVHYAASDVSSSCTSGLWR